MMRVDSMGVTPLSRVERQDPVAPREVLAAGAAKEASAPDGAADQKPVPESVPAEAEAVVPGHEAVEKALEMANDLARRLDVKVLFRRSEETNEFRLEVVDRETGEVIRRVPPDEMVARLQSFSGFEGLLTNTGV